MKNLKKIAKFLVSFPKGLLAADESLPTIKKRFEKFGIEDSEEKRRKWREILFTTNGIENYLSGIILFDETVYQRSEKGITFPELIKKRGMLAGVKVDQGKKDFGDKGEEVTIGLDDLSKRLKEYKSLPLYFTKWRAVFLIGNQTPTNELIAENARRMAVFSRISQERGFVPIPEPEILMDGTHRIEECYEVSVVVLKDLFKKLLKEGVDLESVILKTSMVLPGKESKQKNDPFLTAKYTVDFLFEAVPSKIAGVVFLSGGQSPETATINLREIVKEGRKRNISFPLSFSFARALQEEAMGIWKGEEKNKILAQQAFIKRLKEVSLALRSF